MNYRMNNFNIKKFNFLMFNCKIVKEILYFNLVNCIFVVGC